MKRKIINHWTAGALTPNNEDLKRYHFLVDGKGKIYKGFYPVKANDSTIDGDYAAHTGGGNTRAIGVSLCGMKNFVSPKKPGNFLITKAQTEKLFELNAMLLYQEGCRVVSDDVLMTHMEFGIKNPETSSRGKIDICWLPSYPDIKPHEVGNFIREKSRWYLYKIINKKA